MITLGDRIEMLFAAVHESGYGRFCCKSLCVSRLEMIRDGDFGIFNEPSTSNLAHARQVHVLASIGKELGRAENTVLFAKKSWYEKNHETVQKLSKAIAKAQLWLKAASELPGREEYLDSEISDPSARLRCSRQYRRRDRQLNRIRKGSPGLQSHLGLRFYNAFNDQVIYYGKRLPAGDDMILITVNLDPHNTQEATIEVPLWEWGLPDGGSVMVEDLMRNTRFISSGKLQRIRLDPNELPFSIWSIAPPRGGE
jgi:hypothetical protein